MSTPWRAANISYLKYLSIANTVARSAVKVEFQPKYQEREYFEYSKRNFENGKELPQEGMYMLCAESMKTSFCLHS